MSRYVISSPNLWAADVEQVTWRPLGEDLGADSLASVELAMALEEATGVSIDDDSLAQMKVVGDIMNYLKDHSN